MICKLYAVAAIILISISFAAAQPEIKAVYTKITPVIDGRVDEEVWKEAAVISQFFQREPNIGEPVTEKTEFLFLVDHNNIYIGVHCYDNKDKITAKELARDVSLSDDDRIQVIFDTFLDGRNGYWFQVGPRGSIGDALIGENGKNFNKSWDGLWDGRAKITETGWDAELKIPFKTLGFKKGQDTWGLKLIRHIRRKSESAYWPETSLNADKFQVSDAGRITGLTDISQGIGLDVIPYITGGASKKQDASPSPVLNGGFDAFYQITPSLKTAITVNTDFAQTEVDEKQINLTRFDLYFPEKRDFFLDGAGYFSFGINGDREDPQGTQMIPFFSRRIGLDAGGSPVAIKYGGKFTGKAGKWNMGFIHIKDDNQWENPGYTVGRISRDLGKQSSIGLIGTNGNALSEDNNSLAGIDLHMATSEINGNQNLVYNLYCLKSFTPGLNGKDYSFGSEINYPNDFLNFRIGYLQIGDNFKPGLGFLPRKNISNFYGGLILGPRPKKWGILRIKSGVKYSLISYLNSRKTQSAQIDLNLLEVDLLSGDIISFVSQYQFESLEKDFNIFGSFIIPVDKYGFWRHSVQITSAKRRNLWASTTIGTGSFYSGKRSDWLMQIGCKVAVPLFIGLESNIKYITLPDGDFTTQIYRLNLNFLFGPDLSWYNFAQYDNKTRAIGWQSRLQWIIKPGKVIFLTWNSPLIDPTDRFRAEEYEARLKVKYTIRF
jgi:hypothetical protein